MAQNTHRLTFLTTIANSSGIAIFSVAVFSLIVLGSRSAEAEEIRAADVPRLVRSQDLDLVAARMAVGVAEAQRVSTGLYPNPTLSWSREHFPDDGALSEGEDAVVVAIPVDLSSRRKTRGLLVEADVKAAQAESLRTQSVVVERALRLFYQVIGEGRRIEIEQRAAERLAEGVRVVAARKEAGTASGYDQARIEIEHELATSTLRGTRARAGRLRAVLELLLGVEGREVTLIGTLDQDAALVTGRAAKGQDDPPSVRMLGASALQIRAAQRAAAQAWIPTFNVSVGPRKGFGEASRWGYVLGLSVDLPIFSRGQELHAEAGAYLRLVQARAAAAKRALLVERRRAKLMLEAARRELSLFETGTQIRLARLERAAEAGYREGARSLVELLDARRARTDVEVRRLELALSVKEAEIRVRAARGEFE